VNKEEEFTVVLLAKRTVRFTGIIGSKVSNSSSAQEAHGGLVMIMKFTLYHVELGGTKCWAFSSPMFFRFRALASRCHGRQHLGRGRYPFVARYPFIGGFGTSKERNDAEEVVDEV
jgi:hypothetical protein